MPYQVLVRYRECLHSRSQTRSCLQEILVNHPQIILILILWEAPSQDYPHLFDKSTLPTFSSSWDRLGFKVRIICSALWSHSQMIPFKFLLINIISIIQYPGLALFICANETNIGQQSVHSRELTRCYFVLFLEDDS